MTELTRGFGCDDLRDDAERIRALARRVVADRHGADDLAQQLVLHELSRPAGDRPPRSVGWIVGALRNLASKQRRSAERRLRRERAVARDGHAPAADEAVQHAETLQNVVAAVLALDEPYRTTILLRYLDDLPVADVAERTGVPASTVRVRARRGIDKLREKLQRDLGPGFAALLFSFARPEPAPLAVPSSPHDCVKTGGGTKMTIQITTAAAAFGAALWTIGTWDPTPTMEPLSATREAGRVASGHSDAPDTMRAALALPAFSVPALAATATADPPLCGKVVDRAGQPIAGATVRVYERPFDGAEKVRSGDRIRPPVGTTTGNDGTWSIAALHPFATWGVEVRAPGHAPTLHMQRPDGDTTVTLYPSAVLTGTVRDAGTSAPLEDVTVRVRDLRLVGDRVYLSRGVTTDRDGVYRIEGVRAAAPLHVEFVRAGAASTFATLNLRPHESNRHDVVLGGAAAVELIVLDDATGRPLAGVSVTNIGFASDRLGETDPGGWFRIPMPRAPGARPSRDWDARPRVFVHTAGFCATGAWLPIPPADGMRELELRLIRSGRVTGIVRDLAGKPVAGAYVSWHSEPLRWVEPDGTALVGPDSRDATTDAEGRVVLEPVVPAEGTVEGELRVWALAGTATIGAPLPPVAGATRALEITLGTAVSVSGRTLVNGRGTAAYVYAEPLDGVGRRAQTRATADGRFAIHDLQPGRYRFRLVTGDGTATAIERVVDVSQPVTDLDLELRAQFAEIRGRVLRDDGAPAAGEHVLAFLTHHAEPRGQSTEEPESFEFGVDDPDGAAGLQQITSTAEVGPDGYFALSLTPDPTARYRIGVWQGGFGIVATGVWQGAADVELRLPRLAPVTLELTRGSGEPVPRAGVRWRHPASGREVSLAWRTPRDTASGVLDLELPLGDVELTLRDAATGTERTLTIHVPTGRVGVTF